jgi:membrane protease YdiL (CAAX protease family)
MTKRTIYLYGWITLLLFPIPAYIALFIANNTDPLDFLQLNHFNLSSILSGSLFGMLYALFAQYILKADIFKSIPLPIDKMIRTLNLNLWDALFLSCCAGIGEELLFRSGIQTFLGIWITSFVFVAVHGYFSIKNPKMSLYGLIVFPFILGLSFGFKKYGLWFSVFAHAVYDFVLFAVIIFSEQKKVESKSPEDS